MYPSPLKYHLNQTTLFACVVVIHSHNGNLCADGGEVENLVSIQEYREKTKDYTSSDEQVKKKIDFLVSLCRNVIRNELKSKTERS